MAAKSRARSRPAAPVQPTRDRLVWLWPSLFLVVLLAYQPVWSGGVLWDDAGHITKPELQSLDGLRRIWLEIGATQQYYPVVHSVFWIEHLLWGDRTVGYHLLSIAAHATSAFLLALILRRLKIPGATFAAVAFAVHPVQVESVAWISEQKNAVSTVFFMVAALFYLRFDDHRRLRDYGIALGLFILAILSKTVTVMLAPALAIVLWWRRGVLSWQRDLRPLFPLLVAGAAASVVNIWVERNLIGAQGAEFTLSFVERCLIAGRAFWFYLLKLLWPWPLIFSYPRWQIDSHMWWQYLYPLGAAALIGALWWFRDRSRGPVSTLLLYWCLLFPALGFFDVFPFRYSFVADHFQYVASAVVIAAVCAQLALWSEGWSKRPQWISAVAFAALSAPLVALTWYYSHDYVDSETLYRSIVQRNPSSSLAQNNLGYQLLNEGRYGEAGPYLRAALQLEPNAAEHQANMGLYLLMTGSVDQAVPHLDQAVALNPRYAEAHNALGLVHLQRGRLEAARDRFREAARLSPTFAEAHNNLGQTLLRLGLVKEARAPLETAVRLKPTLAGAQASLCTALQSDGLVQESLTYCQEALRLVPDSAEAHYRLGLGLFRLRRFPEAVAEFERCIQLKPEFGPAYNDLGAALMTLGRVDDALARFDRATTLQPDDADGQFNYANALLGIGRVPDAIVHYTQAARLKPADPAIRNNFGIALEAVGRIREASTQYEEAVRLNPDFPQARANLARARAVSR
jgi:tetratricopeptide (TPR) repeat protein